MNLQITKHPKKILTIALLLIATIAVTGWHATKDTSYAADIKNFDPGNIMSDSVMSDKSTMSVQDIQNFLNSKNYCDNRNTHMAAWYPHLKYNIKDGKFVCMARDSFNGKSAAQIIWQTAQDYSINPQFLLVLLEKEQGLVTDTWPNSRQYQTATGYGCPDTAACDTKYFGLENQLRHAASLFRTVLNGGWSNYPVGKTYVQYHPNASCGGSVVNIQNRATSALYRYTPYQPNKSALEAGYGVGDSCGAYGNRNTWRLFTDWFGDPRKSLFTPMDNARWMQVKKEVSKVNLLTGKSTNDLIEAGRQIKFIDKALVNGKWHLRTEFNYNDRGNYGIPIDSLTEIPYESIPSEWKIINHDGIHKYIPDQERWIMSDGKLPIGTVVEVTSKITVNGDTSYRTKYNTDKKQNAAFHENRLDDLNYTLPLDTPREMTAKANIKATYLDGKVCKNIAQYTPLYIRGKFTYNGTLYFSETQSPVDPSKICFIKSSELNWNPVRFQSFDSPRNMAMKQTVNRINLESGKVVDRLSKGQVIHFSSKAYLNGQWYYRTTHNSERNWPFAVPASQVGEVR